MLKRKERQPINHLTFPSTVRLITFSQEGVVYRQSRFGQTKMNESQHDSVELTRTPSASAVNATIPPSSVPQDTRTSKAEAAEEEDAVLGINISIPKMKNIVGVFHRARRRGLEGEILRSYVAQSFRREE